jgi:hypothetical protein
MLLKGNFERADSSVPPRTAPEENTSTSSLLTFPNTFFDMRGLRHCEVLSQGLQTQHSSVQSQQILQSDSLTVAKQLRAWQSDNRSTSLHYLQDWE